jgi:hypothetical protein
MSKTPLLEEKSKASVPAKLPAGKLPVGDGKQTLKVKNRFF